MLPRWQYSFSKTAPVLGSTTDPAVDFLGAQGSRSCSCCRPSNTDAMLANGALLLRAALLQEVAIAPAGATHSSQVENRMFGDDDAGYEHV